MIEIRQLTKEEQFNKQPECASCSVKSDKIRVFQLNFGSIPEKKPQMFLCEDCMMKLHDEVQYAIEHIK